MARHIISVVAVAMALATAPFGPSPTPEAGATHLPLWSVRDGPRLEIHPDRFVLSRLASQNATLQLPLGIEIAKLTLFIPAGYGLDLTSLPGDPVGVAGASVEPGGAKQWDITADDPSLYLANSCSPGRHSAVWELYDGEDTALSQLPVFVDATTSTEATLGGYKLQMCIPSSSSGTVRIHVLGLYLTALTNPASKGAYTWRAFVTPYVGGVETKAGTFELRSTVPLPARLKLRGRYDARTKRAILIGRFISPAISTSRVPLDLHRLGGSFTGRVTTTRAGGYYSLHPRLKKTTVFWTQTSATAECGSPSVAPAGCLSETLAQVTSSAVRVVVRRKRRSTHVSSLRPAARPL